MQHEKVITRADGSKAITLSEKVALILLISWGGFLVSYVIRDVIGSIQEEAFKAGALWSAAQTHNSPLNSGKIIYLHSMYDREQAAKDYAK